MHSQKALEIADRLQEELGMDALSFVSLRIEEARRAADTMGVAIWTKVAQTLSEAGDAPSVAPNWGGGSDLWKVMQRVEHCRHRAMKLELSATQGMEALRKEASDLAMQWRDLALQMQLLATHQEKSGS